MHAFALSEALSPIASILPIRQIVHPPDTTIFEAIHNFVILMWTSTSGVLEGTSFSRFAS